MFPNIGPTTLDPIYGNEPPCFLTSKKCPMLFSKQGPRQRCSACPTGALYGAAE
jgi:hypothetical protein